MFLGLFGFLIKSWRTLSWATTVPAFSILAFFMYVLIMHVFCKRALHVRSRLLLLRSVQYTVLEIDSLCFYRFLPESPRWLLCQGRTAEAQSVFNRIADWNSKPPLLTFEIHLLQNSILEEQAKEKSSREHRWRIFQDPKLLKRLFVFFIAWFSNSVTYYGLSFNMKNVSGNPYLNVFFLGLVDFPAELSGIFFSNR